MTFGNTVRLLALSFVIVLSSFAAPAQSSMASAAKPAETVVREIDTEGLRAVLKRDPAAPRPLLINFWATWCDACREEFPDLVKIDEKYRPQGLDFVTISLDDVSDIKTEVPKFLRKMRAGMPAYLLNAEDPDPAIKLVDGEWGGALPATFLYNSNGELVFKHFGRFKDAELRAQIEKLVGKKQ